MVEVVHYYLQDLNSLGFLSNSATHTLSEWFA